MLNRLYTRNWGEIICLLMLTLKNINKYNQLIQADTLSAVQGFIKNAGLDEK